MNFDIIPSIYKIKADFDKVQNFSPIDKEF